MKNRFQMNRRRWMMFSGVGLAMRPAAIPAQETAAHGAGAAQTENIDAQLPDQILLKDYRPESVYKIKASDIKKAKFAIIDSHHHAARNAKRLEQDISTSWTR